MSEREARAMAYSAKCARRRRRKAERRNARIQSIVRFTVPFSVGFFSMACFVAGLV